MKDEEIYYQRAWHESGMDFNEFSLEKALTGAGLWYTAGAFTLPKIKDGRVYKNMSEVRGDRHICTK